MIRSGFAVALFGAIFAHSVSALSITPQYSDPPGTGFFDPELGELRQAAFESAVEQWGFVLDGNVPIVVHVSMEALSGNGTQALLASAGAVTVHRNFPGSTPSSWYPAALANQLANADLNGDDVEEIDVVFNAALDGSVVLGSLGWYYGLDGQSGRNIDFVTIALHEVGHGLGFFSVIDPLTGKLLEDDPSAFDRAVIRAPLGDFERLRSAERLAAIQSGSLFWDGSYTQSALGTLAKLFAPSAFVPGSSVSHWDPSLVGELMAPFYLAPQHDIGLLLPALADMGWAIRTPLPTYAIRATPTPTMTVVPTLSASPTPAQPERRHELAYVANFEAGSIAVVAIRERVIVDTIEVPGGPIAMASSPDGHALYVARFQDNAVSMVSTSSRDLVWTVALDAAPYALTVSPDGQWLYASDPSPGCVSVIDTAHGKVTDKIPVPNGAAGLALGASGNPLLVANFDAQTISAIDTLGNYLSARIPLNPILSVRGPNAIATAGTVAFVTSLYSPAMLHFVNLQTLDPILPPLFLAGSPETVLVSRDEAMLLILDSTNSMVQVVEIANHRSLPSIAVQGTYLTSMALSADGKELYVTDAGSDSLRVVDLARHRVTDTLSIAGVPIAISVIAAPSCTGDCDLDGHVTVDELLRGISTALAGGLPECDFDSDLDAVVTVDEIVTASSHALDGCGI